MLRPLGCPTPEVMVLQHQELVGPGTLPALVAERGWGWSLCRLDRGDPLPPFQQPGQILVVLGGTMGVGDRDQPSCSWMPAELALIRARLAAGAPVLGLCLGAQMLAHVAGGTVEPLLQGNPPRALPEVGCGAVQWLPAAEGEPALAGLNACEPVFFWHGNRRRREAGAQPRPPCSHPPWPAGSRPSAWAAGHGACSSTPRSRPPWPARGWRPSQTSCSVPMVPMA